MLTGFHLIHKKNPDPSDIARLLLSGPVFQTCLRVMQFKWSEDAPSVPQGFESYSGERAYEFLLEAICGLRSPVVGETEVFGQFKNFKNKFEGPHPLQLVLENAIVDTKKIRDAHLKDLGGQSYGSVVRKCSREHASVAFMGGGHFTLELLPWVYKEGKRISIHVRDPQKAQEILAKYPRVKILSLDEAKVLADVVIVAAPLTASGIAALVDPKARLVMDLRGESQRDPCTGFKNIMTLDQVFRIIEIHQEQILKAKAQALEAIRQASHKRSLFELMRPFGWDDICVW